MTQICNVVRKYLASKRSANLPLFSWDGEKGQADQVQWLTDWQSVLQYFREQKVRTVWERNGAPMSAPGLAHRSLLLLVHLGQQSLHAFYFHWQGPAHRSEDSNPFPPPLLTSAGERWDEAQKIVGYKKSITINLLGESFKLHIKMKIYH